MSNLARKDLTVTKFKLPEIGEGIESGTVISLLVSIGDKVDVDTPLLELETDKAVVEIPSNTAGIVADIYIKEGEEIKIAQVIMAIDISNDTSRSEVNETADKTASEKNYTIKEVGIKETAFKEAPIKTPIAKTNTGSKTVGVLIEHQTTIPAAPSVRRIARESGVDLNQVIGSGILGRISAEDIYNFVEGNTQTTISTTTARQSPKLPDFSKWGEVINEPMSGVRKVTAKQMQLAWSEIPHVTHFDKCDITELEKLRKTYAKHVEQAGGGKLTPTAIIAKIVASALSLEKFRDFNASVDISNQEVIYKNYVHLGIAVDTPRGLVVPKIRNANQKSIIELSKDLNELAQTARAGKTTLEQMQGGTFTITNLGGIGGHAFTPIINYPEVAILGVSRATWEPRLQKGLQEGSQKNDEFSPRLIMPLSLSYDHRLIDGATAARFLRWVGEALEQPFLVLLESSFC